MITIGICDDEQRELEYAESCVKKYCEQHGRSDFSIMSFSTSFDLMGYVEKNGCFDVLFLDIYMPGFSGTEVAAYIRKRDEQCEIIFCTTSKSHAVDAFDLGATHYITKPYEQDKVDFALDKAVFNLEKNLAKYIVKKTVTGIRKIFIADIVYIESDEHTQIIYMKNEIITTHLTTAEFWNDLKTDSRFVQPHHSYIVNMDYIREITPKEVILEKGESVPVSKRFAKNFKEVYMKYVFGN